MNDMQLQSVLVEEEHVNTGHIESTIVHGNDNYRVTGERFKWLRVYPERELPDHPGSKYPWPVGIPFIHAAVSYIVCQYRRENGH